MIDIIKYIKYFIPFLCGAIIMYFLKGKEIIEVEVPVRVEVKVPVIKKEFDTVYKPYPIYNVVREIDSTIYKKYMRELDSIKRDEIFKGVVSIKEYNEKVENDTLTLSLFARVRGDLLSYRLGVETKPYTIPLDTVIRVKVPQYSEFYGGASLVMPHGENNVLSPSLVPEVLYINKKHTFGYKLGHDFINEYTTFGIYKKF